MYKGICKYSSSRFWDETSNMAKFTTNEICLYIDISDCKITPRFFKHSLSEMVFKLRLMLTGTLIFFLIKQEIFSFIGINRQFVSNHPRKKISLIQVSIDVEAEEANSGENDRYI